MKVAACRQAAARQKSKNYGRLACAVFHPLSPMAHAANACGVELPFDDSREHAYQWRPGPASARLGASAATVPAGGGG